jgi:S1/P1 Nuclease
VKRILLATLVVLSSAALAQAWSDSGHKIVASIAFRQLAPEEQAQVVAILKQHPRFEQDFKSKMPTELMDEKEQNEWLFQQAAVWPDMARGFQGTDRKYSHPTWHYIDLSSFLVPEDSTMTVTVNQSLDPPAEQREDMDAIQVLKMARAKLANKNTPDSEKAVWICWLFHVVGDIHQPLHSTALFAKTLFPTGDRGGNSIHCDQRGNLHSLWDGFLGGRTNFREPRNKAIAFVNDEAKAAIGKAAATKLDEKTWLDESHQICDTVVYDEEVRGFLRGYLDQTSAPPITLTERYLKAGGAVAETRVIQAGYRLGAVTKQVLAGDPN